MSKQGFVARVLASTTAVFTTPLWATVVIAEGVLALIATALTVLSKETNTDGLDSGRMALSISTLLVLAFALFTVPAIVDRIRHTTGASGFLDSLVTSFVVGWTLVFAATPAFLWAMLSTGVGPEVWMPALGSLKLEVLIVDLLVAVAFSTIRKPGAATAVAYAAIVSLVVGPFLVLATTAMLPGTKQATEYWAMDWGKVTPVETDPKTGFPINPSCPTKTRTVEDVPRYDLVWAAVPVSPFVLVSESVEPTIASFVNTMYMGESEVIAPDSPKTTAPIDLFSTIALSTRSLQISAEETIVVNECDLLKETGQPYPSYPYGRGSEFVLSATQSGFTAGLIGQGAIVGAWIVGMVVSSRLRRQK